MNCAKVTIVVLNWNGLNDTIECIESLKKLNYRDFQVVVVDNGSSGDDVTVLRERFGNYIYVIDNGVNYGFAEGNNIGIRYALTNFSPDYVLLLNNDTVVDPEMLTELVKAAQSNASIGILGPRLYSYREPRRILPMLFKTSPEGQMMKGASVERPPHGIDTGQLTEPTEVGWLCGCALLIKQDLIAKIGLLYSGYFAYYEETEYCLRCSRAGFKLIYVPTALLWHKVMGTTGKLSGFYYYYMTRNQFLFVARNATLAQSSIYLLQFLLWRGPTTVVYHVLRKDQKSLKTFCRGAFDGIMFVLTKKHTR